MNYKLTFLSVATIAVAGLYSCSKTSPSNALSPKESIAADALHPIPFESEDTIAYVKNSNNPDDGAGQTHDNGLRAIIPDYMGDPLVEETEVNVFSHTGTYLEGQGFTNNELTNAQDSIENRWDSSLFNMSLGTLNIYLLDQGIITTRAFGYLEGLNAYMNDFQNDSATSGAYDSLCQDIKNLEDSVLNNAAFMATSDAPVVLSATSIARFSAGYWMNYKNASQTMDGEVETLGWFKWFKALSADVSGAVGGAAVGALPGGAGFLPGALVGGISGSVGNAAGQIWNHFFN